MFLCLGASRHPTSTQEATTTPNQVSQIKHLSQPGHSTNVYHGDLGMIVHRSPAAGLPRHLPSPRL